MKSNISKSTTRAYTRNGISHDEIAICTRRKATSLGRLITKRPNGVSGAGSTAFGCCLGIAQFGGKHLDSKPWKGAGTGVMEIVEDYRGDTYRAVYTVRFTDAVYVLHTFQKKSKSGIKTPKPDQDLIVRRLKDAIRDYEERYG